MGESDNANRSVSVGGNVEGGAIVTGNQNVVNVTYSKTTLPPPESVDIQQEFAALRELLSQLETPQQKRITQALETAETELAEPEPDREWVGQALDRALECAKGADGFQGVVENLKTHVKGAVSWLGKNWHKLLGAVGLKL